MKLSELLDGLTLEVNGDADEEADGDYVPSSEEHKQ